ncbi:MAG: C40 family peptidase [Tepidimonas sp.]|uniref:C40 family peptidase n=1 Tax=Tepidimonas sp. TaxID=2002775 RepID=UPI00259E72ED|nr:C40 family peptidase [Tepidimonas sp.]MDM7456625.1 C40 family peptidase [Tepidimonas sp.]
MRRVAVFLLSALLTVAVPAAPLDPDIASDAVPPLGGLLDQWQTVGTETGLVASQLMNTALGLIGVPYRMGGNSAETGFDCSGFVRYVYANTLGLVLPRRAAQQAQTTIPIAKSDLRPGDLVFFNTMRRAFSHVGIYLGDGKFIHAPSKGDRVKISDMNDRYWARRFNGARRVDAAETSLPLAH